jgi:hypothetical protein
MRSIIGRITTGVQRSRFRRKLRQTRRLDSLSPTERLEVKLIEQRFPDLRRDFTPSDRSDKRVLRKKRARRKTAKASRRRNRR